MRVPIHEVKVNPGRREAKEGDVQDLAKSIAEIGLLNPITIDREHILIAGLHRLEAAKLLGWQEIECSVSSLEGLQAELAEIDENFIRADLSDIEYGELLLRRKEIYETLHPETKARNLPGHASNYKSSSRKMMPEEKSFVQDTADKLGVSKSTIERQLQTAKNLTPEAKEILRSSDAKFTKKDALQLSRMPPAQQEETARLLAAKEIKSVEEYRGEKSAESDAAAPPLPFSLGGKRFSSFEESVADLKNPDKDCSCTPDDFLAEITEFVGRFHRNIAWYSGPDYTAVFPSLTPEQERYFREQMGSIYTSVEKFIALMERTKQHE